MSISQQRIDEAVQLCGEFLSRSFVTKKFMQRFLGKLLHATKCTEVARRFTSRLLDLLCATHRVHSAPVDMGAQMDAAWLHAFLSRFNGHTLIRPAVADVVVYVDACLEGAGGHCPGVGLYAATFPPVSLTVFLASPPWSATIYSSVLAFDHGNWRERQFYCSVITGRPCVRRTVAEQMIP